MFNRVKKDTPENDFICKNLSASDEGHLLFAGQDTVSLAKKYGTPLYLYDEDRIREKCRIYRSAMQKAFGSGFTVYYASKAASFKRIYEIMKDENMGIDVVSAGEIYTARTAGFPLENAVFHSNNKTDDDIAFAIENGVGCFAADNEEELYAVDRVAKSMGVRQKMMLRVTPGIDPHTYEAVNTGKVDSKFGFAIETGQALGGVRLALSLENIELVGFHCHVGSQVFESDIFLRTADIMLGFIADVKRETGFETEKLDLGGGIGVRYTASQPTPDIEKIIFEIASEIKRRAGELELTIPQICLEPGRSIVADAGMTLYSVGTVKRITGYKNYVSVDGGMTDNPRYALYKSPYTVLPAGRLSDKRDMKCSLAGRCCESGDILQDDVLLPGDIARGDIIAVLTGGAYQYSMSSNYNRIPRPPVVMLRDGGSYVAVRRESFADVARLDV